MSQLASDAAETLLTLSFVPGIGQVSLLKLTRHPKFLETNIDEMGQLLPSIRTKLQPDTVREATRKARENLRDTKLDGGRLICLLDVEYPEVLRQTPDAPVFLFVKGTLRSENTVAIIGTREPTEHGMEITRRITRYFTDQHWSVISGLALGVDSIGHRAALDEGGHTVAVLAHGLQTIAPRQHASLAHSILESGGALVTEYPYGTPVFPPQYVKRDRIQAGLAQGVVMVQSDLQGGSLHASRAAVEYQRPLGVPQATKRDTAAQEAKIQANQVLIEGGKEAATLLRCRESDLRRVIPLRSREDYPIFEKAMQDAAQHALPTNLFG